jgi:hypothetical protein
MSARIHLVVTIFLGMMVTVAMAYSTVAAIPNCEVEDGSTQAVCYWDGASHGNGKGQSYYAFDYGERIVYV